MHPDLVPDAGACVRCTRYVGVLSLFVSQHLLLSHHSCCILTPHTWQVVAAVAVAAATGVVRPALRAFATATAPLCQSTPLVALLLLVLRLPAPPRKVNLAPLLVFLSCAIHTHIINATAAPKVQPISSDDDCNCACNCPVSISVSQTVGASA